MGKKWDSGMSAGEKLLRLFSLLLFIPQRHSLGSLAEALGCSKQTVLRLIDQLEAVGWAKVLRETEGKKAFYYMARPKRLPQVSLNLEGLEQLILCRNFLIHLLPPSAQTSMDTTLQQSFAYLAEEEAAIASTIATVSGSIAKGRIDYSRSQEVLQTLMKAAKTQTVCEVSYRSALRKEPRAFAFAPMQLVEHHESIYIFGWEVTDKGHVEPVRDTPSQLLLQRFVAVAPTRRFWQKLPSTENLAVFGIISDTQFRVSIRITSPETITYVAERIWSNDQELIRNDDGSLTLSMTAQSPLEVMSWVLSLGSAAEVLSPDWLREKVRSEVTTLATRYDTGTKAMHR